MRAAWLHGATALGLVLLLAAISRAEDAPLPDSVRVQLRTAKLMPIASVTALPELARLGLAALFRSTQLEMADPDGEFQVTDVVTKPNLPARRLAAAGCSAEHCIIYYERGGIAHTWTVVILKIQKSPAEFVWGGSAPRGLADLAAVREALLNGRVDGRRNYW